jgi:flagella basal body P-ring formation protein FlgA
VRKTGEAAMCRGYVLYGGGQRFPMWAEARISASEPRALALAALPAGRPIVAGQLRLETRTGFPAAGQFVTSLEDAEGKIPLRSIAAGTPIRREWLAEPKAVERGDRVVVEARVGGARLEFEAVAEAAGSAGDLIPVLNPTSKRRFLARVEGRDKASAEGIAP